jgi:anti-sigma factor RsiW
VIRRAHHLPDDRLLDCYLNERDGTVVDPRMAEHLTDCEPCGTRYAELTQFMDALHSDSEHEADAVFTPERLRLQRQQIARRIEQVNRPARVITFPGRLVRRGLTSSAKIAPRWTAAAAAAALFVGVVLGASYRWDTAPRRSGVVRDAVVRPTQLTPIATLATAPQSAADDVFLSELEVALDRPHTRELNAIDALTPHFREIRTTR